MAEYDPGAFEELFESEPSSPSASDVERWIGLYTELTGLLKRQLDETQLFSERVPRAMRDYLDRENLKILSEELDAFRRRLTFWRQHGAT